MYNGTASPPTPTIDQLALSGVRLEGYYVQKLCSPTRTALLSGRYSYTLGQETDVIVNGQNCDLALNLLTIADHLQRAGWNTSAYGKVRHPVLSVVLALCDIVAVWQWDAGMTVWGSTPACRGFDHFSGFYNAAEDYFTHEAGAYDYHADNRGAQKAPDPTQNGVYTTQAVTTAVQEWASGQIAARSNAKTFAYVAHQAVHGPMQVPQRFIDAECQALVPASHPTRLIYCGMVRAVDESVKNITDTYKKLGIFDETIGVLTTDNGGHPAAGGSNYPLRGQKATLYEGAQRVAS
jgi:arylsulfatase A-like enzyme